jgi:hypothetical protein
MNQDHTQLPTKILRAGSIAPEFDPPFYRSLHADLATFDDGALRQHFERHGRQEGRCASPAALRTGFIAQIPLDGSVLEIAPSVRPALRGDQVRYFELTNRAGLIDRARREAQPCEECPEIHYVSPIGDISVVTERFDVAFSSHCVEHVPDLAAHLKGVGDLLNPDGRYFLIVPDKRYCFDALLPVSTIHEVLEAHSERHRVHTEAKVREHHTRTTHNDPARHWRGDSVDPSLANRREERAAIARRVYEEAGGGYVDIHAWQFIPESFRAIVSSLFWLGLTRLQVERVYDTVYGQNEFGAVLRLVSQDGVPDDRLAPAS